MFPTRQLKRVYLAKLWATNQPRIMNNKPFKKGIQNHFGLINKPTRRRSRILLGMMNNIQSVASTKLHALSHLANQFVSSQFESGMWGKEQRKIILMQITHLNHILQGWFQIINIPYSFKSLIFFFFLENQKFEIKL